MSAHLSSEYRAYISGPEWAAFRAAYWASPYTVKRCSVCGARRRPGHQVDLNHLRYRKGAWQVHPVTGKRYRSLAPTRTQDVLPACHQLCHMSIITPLSRHRWLRAVALAVIAAVAVLYVGVPLLAANIAGLAILALPRGYSAAAIALLIGLPVRDVRSVYRLCRWLLRPVGVRLPAA